MAGSSDSRTTLLTSGNSSSPAELKKFQEAVIEGRLFNCISTWEQLKEFIQEFQYNRHTDLIISALCKNPVIFRTYFYGEELDKFKKSMGEEFIHWHSMLDNAAKKHFDSHIELKKT